MAPGSSACCQTPDEQLACRCFWQLSGAVDKSTSGMVSVEHLLLWLQMHVMQRQRELSLTPGLAC